MKGSLLIAKFAGIGVYVHWSFLLLIGWIFFAQLSDGGLAAALRGVGLILSLFVCVVLHEFGHALVAKRFGVQTRDITLLPIGGVAQMERIPRNPMHELAIAVAGPAVNVVIAGILAGWLHLQGIVPNLATIDTLAAPWVEMLLWFNVALVVFNILPAFPMDGGRVLCALLATRIDYVAATMIAARVGQSMAIGFAVVGIFSNWFLILIGLFVYIGARAEAESVQIHELAKDACVGDAMVTHFDSLPANATLNDASELLLSTSQNDFPVLEEGRLAGMLLRSDLLAALTTHDSGTLVSQVMRHDIAVLSETADLEKSLEAFQVNAVATLPVVRGEELVGLLTQDNLVEWLAVKSAQRDPSRSAVGQRTANRPRSELPTSPGNRHGNLPT